MPILIVPSHHHSPKTTDWLDIGPYGGGISKNNPHSLIYRRDEWTKDYSQGIVVASKNALNQILVRPEDNFRAYNYARDYIGFDYKTRSHEDQTEKERQDLSGTSTDRSNPSRNYLEQDWKWTWYSSIALIGTKDLYTNSMVALMEVLWKLPILPVLQAYIFDPKYFDELNTQDSEGRTINHEKLKIQYPHGMLAYPKRIWPEFFSVTTGQPVLRVSHHPNRDNDPHYHAFRTDPRLGELQEEWETVEWIIIKLRTNLLPILEKALDKEQQAFYKANPELKQFDKK